MKKFFLTKTDKTKLKKSVTKFDNQVLSTAALDITNSKENVIGGEWINAFGQWSRRF
ncbi:hypothetical protein ACNFU2_20065 [Chryseobacterium sp. PTM-20240506]|uniref:hypothetical protein n=1 Tax=Chryseobacterium sp. PTM-20240506 TaxID=3400631 RepID=UPI003AABC191